MRNIISILLVLGLVVSISQAVVEPLSSPLSKSEMNCTVGAQRELDCEALAAGSYALCAAAGGGWLACTIVAAGAYLGCLAANAIVQ